MKAHESSTGTLPALLSLLLGTGVFAFFYGIYPYHILYQEQFQLFRFSADYAWEKAAYPGGVADYAGRFLTQFWVFAWAGALVMALLLVALQRLVAAVAVGLCRKRGLYPLTFVPSLVCLVLCCDENYLPAAIIQLVIALAAVCLYRQLPVWRWRGLTAGLLAPVVYWMAGGGAWLFITLCWFMESVYFMGLTRKQRIVLVGFALATGIGVWMIAGNWLQYPFAQLWAGRGADRFLLKKAWNEMGLIVLPWLAVVLTCLVVHVIPVSWVVYRRKLWLVGLTLVLSAATLTGVWLAADREKEELMGYDYHIRQQQWGEVIGMADRQTPRSSLAAAYLNLALAKTSRLGDDLFRYAPDGPQDLFPDSGRDYFSPLPTAEIYYYLGMTWDAGRMAFEAMEGLPDFEQSARGVKRLAEVNIINGQYAVARKYLLLLQQTLFYRRWATDALTYLYADEQVDRHPEWGSLRAKRFRLDFFSAKEKMETMLAILYKTNTDNHMAYEYLLAYVLLEKNLEHFYSHYLFGGEGVEYSRIPRSYQEALLLIWSLEKDINAEKPWDIAPELVTQIKAYAALFSASGDAEAALKKDFSQTAWYYLHFKNIEK